MFISQFQIRNYKSFLDSGPANLSAGFNVICGANNSGKTACLEALDIQTNGSPHRSLRTLPSSDTPVSPDSSTEFTVQLDGDRLSDLLKNVTGVKLRIAIPTRSSEIDAELRVRDAHWERRLIELVLSRTDLSFKFRRPLRGEGAKVVCASIPSYSLYQQAQNSYLTFQLQRDGQISQIGMENDNNRFDIGINLAAIIQNRIYRFHAERLNVGVHALGTSTRLATNASNLPEVLEVLRANPARFDQYNALVREVLPQVRVVSLKPINASSIEIRIWTHDPASGREDLTFPLAQCGTGIGQVLAMLYVAVFETSPQVLLIDEPQSFLHPGAVRKLIQVLKTYPQHQYIISTHSPTVISAANPSSIILSKWSDGESKLEEMDLGKQQQAQSYLVEVGARLSDVFGADSILWVEGRTEEICFPRILERIGRTRLQGTVILGVRSTGELDTKDADKILDIYGRLSHQNSLMPPALGFIFDRESRTTQQMDDLRRRSRDRLTFLERRMFENYLLDPWAICSVLNRHDDGKSAPYTENQVQAFLDASSKQENFYRPLALPQNGEEWVLTINAAEVLKRMFAEITSTRVAFDKTLHSVELVDLVLEHSSAGLRQVHDLITAALERGRQSVGNAK